VFKDQTVRKEMEKIDRWIQAASPLLKNVSQILAPGATPTGNSGGGSSGTGTLADHNHSRSGQGGNTLGDDTTQMEAQGNWYYDDKIGIKNVVPVGRLHIGNIGSTIDLGPLIVLTAAAAQTNDLFQSRNSSDVVKSLLNATHQFALGRASARSRLDISPTSASEIGIIVEAASTPTANLQEWRLNGGAARALVDEDCRIGLGVANPTARLHIQTTAVGDRGIQLQQFAGQTANLMEVLSSGGGLIGFQIAKQGHVGINVGPTDTLMLNAFLSATVTAATTLMKFTGDITDNTGGFQHIAQVTDFTLKGSGDVSSFEQMGYSCTINYQGTNGAAPDITAGRFMAVKSGTGPVGFLTGMYSNGDMSGTGTVLQYSGFYIVNPSRSGGALSSCVGLIIEAMSAGTSNYAIKSLGGQSYHAGKFGINIDPPTAMLHLVQDASATIGLKIRRNASGSTGDLLQILDQTSAKLAGFDAKGRLLSAIDGVTTPLFYDFTTTTKKLGIDASGITAATTRYWGALDVSGANVLSGDQAPAVSAGRMGKVDATAQGAAIGATNLTNGAKVGYYVVHYTIEDTTADVTAGTIQFQIGYTDDIGATTQVGAAMAMTAVGRDRGSFQVYLASGELSYQTNLVGIFGAAKYALRVRVVFLG
jgi:hypothetical protein